MVVGMQVKQINLTLVTFLHTTNSEISIFIGIQKIILAFLISKHIRLANTQKKTYIFAT